MNQNMKGKRVIVTGASSGIGRATAELLMNEGASVALVGRRESTLADIITNAQRGAAFVIPADLSHEEQTEQCVARSVEALDGLDVLVNAAGILKGGR
ncbi:MAG TPA: SDR family NAD(P)-dependent oxidoreductase, partial [Blastocatellia bacterium]|nr:SDR family NAD(P)-dependent oxidoreductase [Blastocatellia bacterium]